MAHITIITTGGTIAATMVGETGHIDATVAGAALLRSVPGLPTDIEIRVDDFMKVVSLAMTLEMSHSIAQRINSHLAQPDCSGVIVTHGTDTMEESAYLADLLVDGDKPVIFTGAQRSADHPATDGPQNIRDAVTLARAAEARGLGVVVMFEQQFHAAREVTKFHTSRVDAFVSHSAGKLGEVDGEIVSLSRRPVLRRTFVADRIEPRVDLIKMAMGTDDRLVRYSAASGAQAIVLEGFGRGNANPSVAQAIREIIASGTPVIVTSRCGDGRVKPVYGNGGGKDLEKAGAIFAGSLSGQKARILTSVLLGAGMTEEALRENIAYLGG